ncbi:MAG: DUF3500 domain-containing protein, partial [Dehalococcoidia bacterium]
FDDPERTRWFYTPTTQAGLPLTQMSQRQGQLAQRFVATGLSLGGYNTASTIMGLENTLDSREGWRTNPYHGSEGESRNRNPQLYFLCVYGDPASETWGWHYGGHHISLNVTIEEGRLLSPTPTFFGSDPAESAGVGPSVLRPLAGEEDLARELLHALDEGRRAKAVISPVAPPDLIQANRTQVEDGVIWLPLGGIFSSAVPERARAGMDTAIARLEAGITDEHREALRYSSAGPKGLAAAAMTPAQHEILDSLLRQYIYRLPDDVAEVEWAEIEKRGIDQLHFAWAGGRERREPHYYRIQGERLLIEYDNVQNGANHIHAVWRDPENDFGGGPLAAHRRVAHGA